MSDDHPINTDGHLQPDTTFIMPKEVATSLLVNNTRLSNKSRKRAHLARSVRIVSLAPIVREGPHWFIYDADAAASVETRLGNRYAKLPLKTLLRLVKRCAKLRERLQREYQRTDDAKTHFQLNAAAERVELQSDTAAAEIKRRAAV